MTEENETKRYIYVAEFEYGMPNLSKLEVVKETPKTFQVGEQEKIVGFVYIGKRVLKSVDWFDNAVDAVEFLAGRAELNVTRRRERLESAKRTLSDLEELAKELEE